MTQRIMVVITLCLLFIIIPSFLRQLITSTFFYNLADFIVSWNYVIKFKELSKKTKKDTSVSFNDGLICTCLIHPG